MPAGSPEVVCGTLFLVMPVAPFAAVFFAASFLGIGFLIRLGFLAEMVALSTLLYFYPGSLFADWIARTIPASAPTPASGPLAGTIVAILVAVDGGVFARVTVRVRRDGDQLLLEAHAARGRSKSRSIAGRNSSA